MKYRSHNRVLEDGDAAEAANSGQCCLPVPVRVDALRCVHVDQDVRAGELRRVDPSLYRVFPRRKHIKFIGLHSKWGHELEVRICLMKSYIVF